MPLSSWPSGFLVENVDSFVGKLVASLLTWLDVMVESGFISRDDCEVESVASELVKVNDVTMDVLVTGSFKGLCAESPLEGLPVVSSCSTNVATGRPRALSNESPIDGMISLLCSELIEVGVPTSRTDGMEFESGLSVTTAGGPIVVLSPGGSLQQLPTNTPS